MGALLLVFLLAGFSACRPGNDDAGKPKDKVSTGHTSQEDKDDILPLKKDENKNREKWQKPESVVAMMGDLSGKTVADIGAGTGYFTFRIAVKAKKVIAIDIVKEYLEILENLKEKLPVEIQQRIETRLATENDPKLKKEETDLVVMINTLSYISDKLEYLKTVKRALKPGGKIFIVDFKMKNLPIEAPGKNQRIPMYELENMLAEAGYVRIQSDDTTLDYQYIVAGYKK